MPKAAIPIHNGFYSFDDRPLSAQECINYYPVKLERPGLSEAALFGTPGLVELTTTGVEPNRGAHVMSDVPYYVNGEKLYRIDRTVSGSSETFTAVELGDIPGTSRVSMADNGNQLCIVVPGVDGFIYDKDTDVFQKITDPDFKANGIANNVTYIDGFFVFTSGQKIFHSELNDGLSYNALDFGEARVDPDSIKGQVVFNNQLFIFGSETIEAFQNVGGSTFAFQRINGFVIPKGLRSQFSIKNFDSGVMFVGGEVNERPGVFYFSGAQPQRVSTIPIERELTKLSAEELDSVISWVYAQAGAYFYSISLPSRTFTFDSRSGEWHERTSLYNNQVNNNRISEVVNAYGRLMVGDQISGRIGQIDRNTYTEYGELIFRRFTPQPLAANGEPIFVDEIELTMVSGSGSFDRDPEIRVEPSYDGGYTFGNERVQNIGLTGDRDRRAIWFRFGRFRRYANFRFTFTEDANPDILRLEAEVSSG